METLREAALLTFSFKFINKYGVPDSIVPKMGRITRDGVVLGDSRIFYQDIFKIERYKDKIIFVLMPFSALSKEVTEHIFAGYTSLMIDAGNFAERVQTIVNRRVSTSRANDKKRSMTPEEAKEHFKTRNCPHCDATLDLTDVPDSHFIFCEYCEVLFDRHGYVISDGEDYKICPEIGFFDRVREYTDYSFYILRRESRFRARKYYCSDTFLHLLFQHNVFKNFTLLFGVPLTIYEKLRSTRGRSPGYPELVRANLLSLEGKLQEAEIIYNSLLMRNPNHPGLHLNLGLAYLKKGKKLEAIAQFKRSLLGCGNYQPTLDVIEKYQAR